MLPPIVAISVALCAALSGFAQSTRDYCRDGLLALWDGVENDGFATHAGTTTVWKDVVKGRLFALNSVTVGANGMIFAGDVNSYGELAAEDAAATFGKSADHTVEIVLSTEQSETVTVLHGSLASGVALGWLTSSQIIAGCKSTVACTAGSLTGSFNTFTIPYKGNLNGIVWENGVQGTAISAKDYWTKAKDTVVLGMNAQGKYPFAGTVHCIRVYDHVLSEEDIQANRAVDVERFVNGNTGYETGVVYVQGDPSNLGTVTPAYGVAEWTAGETFTATAQETEVVDEDGQTRQLDGWQLRVVSPDGVSYSEGPGATCTAKPQADEVAELTWVYGLPTSPITIDAYRGTENALVWFDGVNNTGSGHDGEATSWKNLAGEGRDGALAGCTWHDRFVSVDATGGKGMVTFDGRHDAAFTVEVTYMPRKSYAPTAGSFGRILGGDTSVASMSLYANKDNFTSASAWITGFGLDAYAGNRAYDASSPHTESLTFDGTVGDSFSWLSDSVGVGGQKTKSAALGSATTTLANRPDGQRGLDMDLYAMRLYNGVLGGDDLKFNAEVDRIRLIEGCPELYRLRGEIFEHQVVSEPVVGCPYTVNYAAAGAERWVSPVAGVRLEAKPTPNTEFLGWEVVGNDVVFIDGTAETPIATFTSSGAVKVRPLVKIHRGLMLLLR